MTPLGAANGLSNRALARHAGRDPFHSQAQTNLFSFSRKQRLDSSSARDFGSRSTTAERLNCDFAQDKPFAVRRMTQ